MPGKGKSITPRGVLVGSNVNQLPEWALTPYFAIPASVPLTVGREITIYGDSLISLPILDNNLEVEYTCDIGTASGNNYVISPVTGDIGEHTLSIVFKTDGTVITTQTINLNVIAAQTGAVSILMLGDSLVYLGHADIATGIDSGLVPTVTFIGSQGTTIKHEGVAGKSFESIMTSGSPLYISGAFNVAAYFANNSLATPDYVWIRFGVNDMFLPGSFNLTDSYLTGHVINPAKALIAAFLNYDANLKVIIGLPTISENTGAGWNANYDEATYPQDQFIRNIYRMRAALVTAFDLFTYNARVLMSNEAIYLDRNDGYPKSGGVHNNGVHPAASGYSQLGEGFAATLNQQMSLIPSGLTLSLISGGVKVDWTDNSAGEFETEIWGKSDDGSYTLITTIAVGTVTYSQTLDAVDLRYYKLRGKNGTYFTPFGAEQSIAMLSAELVTNGNLSAWTGDNPNGWTVAEGANGSFSEVSGACRMQVTGSGVSMQQAILTNGAKYRFRVNMVAVAAEQLSVVYSSLKYRNWNTTGQKEWYDTTDGTALIFRRWSGNTDVTFDDVSVKRVLMP